MSERSNSSTTRKRNSRSVSLGRNSLARPRNELVQRSASRMTSQTTVDLAAAKGDFLKSGSIFHHRWEIKKRLGDGGFGQVFLAFDKEVKKNIALKLEEVREDVDMVLPMEVEVLVQLEGKKHFCKVYGAGKESGYNFIAMTLCGSSIATLRSGTPNNYFSGNCTLALTGQIVEAVRVLHEHGYLHRDLKPPNFCMGKYDNNKDIIYVLDFGLARKFINTNDPHLRIRSPRMNCAFRGTVRYASVNAHDRKELGRVDDLWSVFYVMVEMCTGKLPWRNESDRNTVSLIKKAISPQKLVAKLVFKEPILEIISHMESLGYADEPNYDKVLKGIEKAKTLTGEASEKSDESKLDWLNGYIHCRKPCRYDH